MQLCTGAGEKQQDQMKTLEETSTADDNFVSSKCTTPELIHTVARVTSIFTSVNAACCMGHYISSFAHVGHFRAADLSQSDDEVAFKIQCERPHTVHKIKS